jgi:hypothetical protein
MKKSYLSKMTIQSPFFIFSGSLVGWNKRSGSTKNTAIVLPSVSP